MPGDNGSAPQHGAGERTPMVLIHGFTGTPVMWDPILPWLEQHHDVVAIPLPGHFGGAPFDDPGEHIVESLLDVAEAQLDERGIERAHLVGNSLGGWASLLLAGRGRALSTVAIAPAGGWELRSREVRRTLLMFRRMQYSLALAYPLALELAARPRSRWIVFWDTVAYPQRLPGPLARKWLEAARNTPARDLMLEHSPTVNAPERVEIDTPVRIAWGTHDRILPYDRFSARWRTAVPNADWVMLDKLGHVPMSDDPELVARTILDVSTAAAPAPAV